MSLKRPSAEHLRRIAHDLGFAVDDADLASYGALVDRYLGAYDALEQLADPIDYPGGARTPGRRVDPKDNPFGAWYVQSEIKTTGHGKLHGRRIVLKDNICLAGVPMMNGSSILEGYVPDIDATLVTRILDAGGEIVGKAVCENYCFSGGSHTSATGPVHNPHRHGFSAGGSSSGCAALVGANEVEMAIGGDQAGSIRGPAAWCGLYGLKPTYGLVPYTGVMPIEFTLDHVGPMTATVSDNALLLDVVAGTDGLDARQADVRTDDYVAALARSCEGLRVGVVAEGFGLRESEPDVDACVRATAQRLARLGMEVAPVSIPMHAFGLAIWGAVAIEGATDLMMLGNGYGTNHRGLHAVSLMRAQAAWRLRTHELPETVKLVMLMGRYVGETQGGRCYAKAMNLVRALTEVYDAAFARFDLLLMPTVPMKATPLPGPDASREEIVGRALEVSANTAPFNLSRHPALSFPCGMADGLPIGAMLVGRHFEEATIYRAARAFEHAHDWRALGDA